MKRWGTVQVLVASCVLFSCTAALAANNVTVESRGNIPLNATNVKIGVFISNDIDILGLVLPLELRSENAGSYIKTQFTVTIPAANRLGHSPLEGAYDNGVDSVWPAGQITTRKFAVVGPAGGDTICPKSCGDVAHDFSTSTAQVDFTSPDAVLHAVVSTGDSTIGELIALSPGLDTPDTNHASLLFKFDVTGVQGVFDIDTCCVCPANHLVFVNKQVENVVPSFTKGRIGINTDLDVKTLNNSVVPESYSLEQNYPNPFNASTVVRFSTQHDGQVRLDIFNILGRRVRTLVDQFLPYGLQAVEWDAKDDSGTPVSTGVYFYRISAEGFTSTRKMVLLK